MSNPLKIIGVGDDGTDGLAMAARKAIDEADVLFGDQRTLDLVDTPGPQRIVVGADMQQTVERIAQAIDKKRVVLVYGDPLFYGWARFLCDRLGKDAIDIVPHVSSMQLAFARVRESWDDAYLTNLANHSLNDVIERIRIAEKVGLFTTELQTPPKVAKALADQGIDYFDVYVCENLGSPDERVTSASLADIAQQQFAPLNVMILVRQKNAPDRARQTQRPRRFGNPAEAFIQSKPHEELLTPAELRAVALAELDIRSDSIVWDVGAGSGSVGIEAAQLAASGTVFSIEMDNDEYALIQENAERFRVTNVKPVLGRAPQAWANLPDPDCIFVEGAGGEARNVVEAAYERLKPGGRLVSNLSSIQNIADLHASLSQRSPQVSVWMINIARGNFQLERIRFDAVNPTFLLSAIKPVS